MESINVTSNPLLPRVSTAKSHTHRDCPSPSRPKHRFSSTDLPSCFQNNWSSVLTVYALRALHIQYTQNFRIYTFATLRRTGIMQKCDVYTPKNIPTGLYSAHRHFTI